MKKLWILSIVAFLSVASFIGCSADAVADISSTNSSYINTNVVVEE